jgi:phosphoribosylanthranilate isomerase
MFNSAVQVKICGVTRLEDARYISGLMADRIGFIFTPESKRAIEPGKAGAIIEWLGGIEPVGVFMNQEIEQVQQISRQTGLKRVQLHGNEPAFYCAQLPFQVTKTISITSQTTKETLQEQVDVYAPVVDEFLFDTAISSNDYQQLGGTGTPFNWKILTEVSIPKPWFLAGGISAKNIKEAWEILRPTGFDLSSSVESEPGIKNFDLLDDLFESIQSLS